jgi:pimeloyl-ACP methyl ester carboxylesterase
MYALRCHRPIIVGHSMGSFVAQESPIAHPAA